MSKMQYNVCAVCGAKDGRAGLLISTQELSNACVNCHETKKTGSMVLHTHLHRTQEEVDKMVNSLLNGKTN